MMLVWMCLVMAAVHMNKARSGIEVELRSGDDEFDTRNQMKEIVHTKSNKLMFLEDVEVY